VDWGVGAEVANLPKNRLCGNAVFRGESKLVHIEQAGSHDI
jgi:hypothetical protein